MRRRQDISIGLLWLLLLSTAGVPAHAEGVIARPEVPSRHLSAPISPASPGQSQALATALQTQHHRPVTEKVALNDKAASTKVVAAEQANTKDDDNGNSETNCDWGYVDCWSPPRAPMYLVGALVGGLITAGIGTPVVAGLALYETPHLYQVATSPGKSQWWSDVSLSGTHAASQQEFDESDSQYVGLRYTTGFRKQRFGFGVGAEIGQSTITLRYGGERKELSGDYWLLGPLLRIRVSHQSLSDLEFSLMAGSSQSSHVSSLVAFKIAFSHTFSSRMRLALSMNGVRPSLHDIPSTLAPGSSPFTGFGAELGYSF